MRDSLHRATLEDGLHSASWLVTAPGPTGVCKVCHRDYRGRKRVYCTPACREVARRALCRAYARRFRAEQPEENKRRKRVSKEANGWRPLARQGLCAHCGAPFLAQGSAAKEGTRGAQRYCGRECQGQAWYAQRKAKAAIPRPVSAPVPLPPPPAFPACVPGTTSALLVSPPLRGRHPHEDAQRLHGVLSLLLGRAHGQVPAFSLWHEGEGWRVHWFDAEGIQFAGRTCYAEIGGQTRELRCGPLPPAHVPPLLPGRYQAVLRTRTALVFSRNGHREVGTFSLDTARAWLADLQRRLGLSLPATVYEVRPALRQVTRFVGGEICRGPVAPGRVVGWEGHVTLTVDAGAAWLWWAATRTGIGGLTSMGFGRVRVLTQRLDKEEACAPRD